MEGCYREKAGFVRRGGAFLPFRFSVFFMIRPARLAPTLARIRGEHGSVYLYWVKLTKLLNSLEYKKH